MELQDLREAYQQLAEAQAANDLDATQAAWERLGQLIEGLGDQPPPMQTGQEAPPPLPDVDFTESQTPEEQRDAVNKALFDAALSGNVPAVLKWLELNQPKPGEIAALTTAGNKRKKKRKPRISQKLPVKEALFLEHYFDCDDCRGNGTKAARHAGFKGNDNTLAVKAHMLLKKDKIREYVEARLAQSAMSIEELLRGLSEMASGIAQHFIEFDQDGRPQVSLAKAMVNGKIQYVKGIQLHANGQVKNIQFESPLQARGLLIRYHMMALPPKPGDDPTPEEMMRIGLARARQAIELVQHIAQQRGQPLTYVEAAQRALKWFPEAKQLIKAHGGEGNN